MIDIPGGSVDFFRFFLFAAALIFLVGNLLCVGYLAFNHRQLTGLYRNVSAMLVKIALYEIVPLLWFTIYFYYRLMQPASASPGSVTQILASIGYVLALIGLTANGFCAAVLAWVGKRRQP